MIYFHNSALTQLAGEGTELTFHRQVCYKSNKQGSTIPDICHEPHEHVRVKFFWPV